MAALAPPPDWQPASRETAVAVAMRAGPTSRIRIFLVNVTGIPLVESRSVDGWCGHRLSVEVEAGPDRNETVGWGLAGYVAALPGVT